MARARGLGPTRKTCNAPATRAPGTAHQGSPPCTRRAARIISGSEYPVHFLSFHFTHKETTMKKHLLAIAITVLAAGTTFAQANDTLAKIKGAGAVTLGVRESSGLSYTLGNGKYVGFHT